MVQLWRAAKSLNDRGYADGTAKEGSGRPQWVCLRMRSSATLTYSMCPCPARSGSSRSSSDQIAQSPVDLCFTDASRPGDGRCRDRSRLEDAASETCKDAALARRGPRKTRDLCGDHRVRACVGERAQRAAVCSCSICTIAKREDQLRCMQCGVRCAAVRLLEIARRERQLPPVFCVRRRVWVSCLCNLRSVLFARGWMSRVVTEQVA